MDLALGMITTNALDPVALAAWWAEQLGATVAHDYDGEFVVVSGDRLPVNLGFQKVADPTPGPSRVHLDLGSPDLDAEVERLVAAGASLVARRGESGLVWATLTDPEGNEFCVAAGHEGETPAG